MSDSVEGKIHKRNSVVLAIRKLTYAAEEPAPQPSAETVKEFMTCSGNLRLEVTLDKEVSIHSTSIYFSGAPGISSRGVYKFN